MIRGFLAALATAAALAASANAAGGPFGAVSGLPGGWSHAQINVVTKRQPHTLTFDRGRLQAVTPEALALKARDGSVVTVAIGPSTVIKFRSRTLSVAQLRRGLLVMTVSVDGAPASAVRVVAA